MTPITELTLESGPKAILYEWLASYFDGGTHTVGLHSGVVYPRAQVSFDQGLIPQPMDTGTAGEAVVEIRVTMAPGGETRRAVTETERLAAQSVTMTFWMRSARQDMAEARAVSQRTAELLKFLLTHPSSRLNLARNGITHLDPRKPSVPAGIEWAQAMVICRARLCYAATN